MSGGFGGVEQVLAGIDAGAAGADLPRSRSTRSCSAASTTTRCSSCSSASAAAGVIVRFIEYMDVGNRNDWRSELVVPSKELAERIGARWPLVPLQPDYRGEVAERYAYADGAGEIGFISSVSQPFCGDCSRARLSSDGVLYTCLFATHGTSLRDALRGGRER